jgi:large subunit ribosomal protein L17
MVSHRLKFAPRLGRDKAHRQALLRNMVTSLITHERILTTHPKAKYAQRLAEKMVTFAKDGTLQSRRLAQAFVKGEEAQQKLFRVLGERYAFRSSGFTRVVHAKRRNGDNAPLSYLEFVDRPGELRPSRICTPQSFQQVQLAREINTERQRQTRY